LGRKARKKEQFGIEEIHENALPKMRARLCGPAEETT